MQATDPLTAFAPTVEEAIGFVDDAESLDEVAAKLAYLRAVKTDLDAVVGVLRRHVMTAIGEPSAGGPPEAWDVPL